MSASSRERRGERRGLAPESAEAAPHEPGLARTGALTLALRGGHRLLLLGISILLARALGAGGYGVYSHALAWGILLSLAARLGLPALLVREVATYRLRGAWGHVRGVLRRAHQAALLASAVLVIALLAATWLLSSRIGVEELRTLRWAAVLVPLLALASLNDATLRGLHRVVSGEATALIVLPALLLVFILVHVAIGTGLDASTAMALHVAASVGAFLVGAWRLGVELPGETVRSRPAYEDHRWARSAVPLGLLAGSSLISAQTDIVMLGLLATSGDVGVYRLVFTGGRLVSFPTEAIGAVLGPQVAGLHAAGARRRLQRLLTRSTRLVVGVSTLAVLGLVLCGRWLLLTLFGEAFAVGYPVLVVLSVGQLLCTLTGPGALVLNMTGHERDTARSFAGSALLNVTLNGLLIPPFGMMGAAVATLTARVLWSGWLWWLVRHRLGVDPSVFARERGL